MAQTIQCGACQRRIRAPDNLPLNRTFRCPGCGATLALQAPAPQPTLPLEQPFAFNDPAPAPAWLPGSAQPNVAPAPLAGADASPLVGALRTPAPESDPDTWLSIRRGAGLFMAAHGMYVVALLLFLILWVTLVSGDSDTSRRATGKPRTAYESSSSSEPSDGKARARFLAILAWLVLLSLSGNWVVAVVAEGFWLAAPWRSGARGLAIGLLVLNALILLHVKDIFLLIGGAADHGPNREPAQLGAVVFFLIEAARLTVLAAFLTGIGRNLRHSSLTTGAGILTVVTPLALGVLLTIVLIILNVADLTPTVLTVVVCLMVVGKGALVLWGLFTVMTLHGATRRRVSAEASV
jgi:hypothetical protein